MQVLHTKVGVFVQVRQFDDNVIQATQSIVPLPYVCKTKSKELQLVHVVFDVQVEQLLEAPNTDIELQAVHTVDPFPSTCDINPMAQSQLPDPSGVEI